MTTGIEWTDRTWNPLLAVIKSAPVAPIATQKRLPKDSPMGVSVENQQYTRRIDALRQVPAAVRFLSCEPLLSGLNLNLKGIHWVIVGGESGANYRAPNPDWVRSIRDQCQDAGVAFFFKQWGGRTPKAGGRLLDNKVWDEMPKVAI